MEMLNNEWLETQSYCAQFDLKNGIDIRVR